MEYALDVGDLEDGFLHTPESHMSVFQLVGEPVRTCPYLIFHATCCVTADSQFFMTRRLVLMRKPPAVYMSICTDPGCGACEH